MESNNEPLITPPKEVKLDLSESQTPANTMTGNPNKHKREKKKELCNCKQSTLCCMFAFGVSLITISATCPCH